MRFLPQNFRSRVSRGSTPHKIIIIFKIVSQSKVYEHRWDFSLIFLVFCDHDVLQFDVPMHESLFMKVRDSFQQLSDDLFSNFSLGKTVPLDEIEKIGWEEVSDHVDWVLRRIDKMQFSNIGMLQLLPYRNFIEKAILNHEKHTPYNLVMEWGLTFFFEHFTA